MRSNLWERADHASEMAVVFESTQLELSANNTVTEFHDLHSTVNLGQVAIGNHLRWLVADTNLEASWTPVDKLDSALSLQASNSVVHLLWYNISSVEQAGSHVLSITRVALDHLVCGLEARHRDLLHRVGFVARFGRCNNWRIGDKGEMDARIWDEIGLEFVEIDVERTIESKRGSDGRNN